MGGKGYQDPGLALEARVEDLISQMSLEEKTAQLGGVWVTDLLGPDGFSLAQARKVAPHGIGEITRISGATALEARESAALANEIQHFMVEETRLGIPVLVHEEGIGGFSARGATVFPQAISLGASFDPELIEEVAGVVREQMRAVGARHCLAPVLDVARDPRWGRVEETFGEDPVLVGTLGTAYVRGLQSSDLKAGVLATGKHFIGHAAPVGGRNHATVHIGPRELREVHAEPFAVAIAHASLRSVMNAYCSVDGLPCAASWSVLTGLLRDELQFNGFVVADYHSLLFLSRYHRVAEGKGQAAAAAIRAGLDVELPEADCYGEPLLTAVTNGVVPLETLDASVRRVLRAKFALGLFENPFVEAADAAIAFDTPAQRDLARRAAGRSIILLTNDGTLPLSLDMKRIAVIGPAADDARLLQGDYHYPAHQEIAFADGSDESRGWSDELGPPLPFGRSPWNPGRYYTNHVTPFAGVRALVGDHCEVLCSQGCDVSGSDTSGIGPAVGLAASCDVAIVVVGGRSGMSAMSTVGETRDAVSLELTGVQAQLVRAICEVSVRTVVIVLSGRAHSLTDVASLPNALVYAGPLGEAGGSALAEVLFGLVNPSARLPVSLPRSVGQLPVHLGQRAGAYTSMFYGAYTDSPTEPLFPFGHGLSYTTFSYHNLSVEPGDTRQGLSVAVDVRNCGDRPGEEVVQLYVSDLIASVARPDRQLAGFARVPLQPGEHRRVEFQIHPSRLAFYNEELRRVIEPGDFRVDIGASSADIRASATVTVTGEVVPYPISSIQPTTAKVL